MEAREAENADQWALIEFRCARTDASYDLDVEDMIHDAPNWRLGGTDRHVLVVFDDGEVVAVVAYREREADVGGGYHIAFGGVAVERQQQGLGPELFANLIHALAEKQPGAPVTWLVHRDNIASQRMCAKIGYGEGFPYREHPDYLVYSYRLPMSPE